jgi:hypothetical protein
MGGSDHPGRFAARHADVQRRRASRGSGRRVRRDATRPAAAASEQGDDAAGRIDGAAAGAGLADGERAEDDARDEGRTGAPMAAPVAQEPWRRDVGEVVAELGTDIDRGLGSDAAAARLARYGPNQLQGADVEVDRRVREGSAADTLMAESSDLDLLVLGSRGLVRFAASCPEV